VLTDHTNLTFWKNPKTVNRRVAQWFNILQDYNLQIKHVPGKLHAAADMLSHPPTSDKGENDNWDLTLLPPHLFIRTINEQLDSWTELLGMIKAAQGKWKEVMNRQREDLSLEIKEDDIYYMDNSLVIPPEDSLKRLLLRRYHDAPTAGHPGRDRTISRLEKTFWWSGMKNWIDNYVKGCTICQQNKSKMHPNKPSPFRIPTGPHVLPFQTIAMDLITNLPLSEGYDAILTIVDHGCT
jgi:hypothetical protein